MVGVLEASGIRRVLLLNPPIADTAEAEEQAMIATVEPFGLLRLGTYFRARGCEVDYIDGLRDEALAGQLRRHVRKQLWCGDDGGPPVSKPVYHFGLDEAALVARLQACPAPDVICVSTVFTWHAESTRDAIAACRRAHPQARIVLGGNFPTLCPDAARRLGADEVWAGDVPGASFLPTAIDLLRQPATVDYLRMIKGCPFRCSYCVTHTLSNGRVETREPEAVYAEMEGKAEANGTRTFVFYDDCVLYRPARFLGPFLDLVAQSRSGYRLEFALGFSAAQLDESLVRRLREAGVERAILALETTSEERGRRMGRPQRLEQFRRAVRLLQDYGFRGSNLRAFYLIGLPGQSTEEILRALVWLYRLGVTPSLTTYALTPRTADMTRYGGEIAAHRPLDELAPCLWRFAHPGMRVAELDAIYRFFHERHYPLERILDSVTVDPIVCAMQRIAREDVEPD